MRISDWSSDVCSSDLSRGCRAVAGPCRSRFTYTVVSVVLFRSRWISSPRAPETGCVIAVIWALALLLASCQVDTEGPADELARRLHTDERQRFGFLYRAEGTSILDCMLPNRQFHVTVDASSGSVELRHGSITGSPLAVSLPDALLVHRSAFEGS